MDSRVVNFMGYRRIAGVISIVLVLVSIAALSVKQLNLGLDFTGGTLVEVAYDRDVSLSDIRQSLAASGFEDAVVQNFGAAGDVLIRLAPLETDRDRATIGDDVLRILRQDIEGEASLRRVEFVGPQVGEELRDQGGLGLLLALFMIMLYVAFRFQLKFSIGAVAALAHDVLIVLGVFSIFSISFDLTVLAALLAVIGYSLNDTIVVSDRIRENFRKLRRVTPDHVINVSLTQMLARTLVTSSTTLLVLLALLFVGGELIRGFALALTVGVLVGTYSSIYVASNMLMVLGIHRDDLIVTEKDQAEIDARP